MERIIKSLEINKVLNDVIPTLIEVFVKFYGEEFREEITKKFNNMILVGYYDNKTLGILISYLKKATTQKYLKEVFDKFQIEYTEENVKSYTSGYVFDDIHLFPIIEVCKYIKLVKNGKDELLGQEIKRKYGVLKQNIPELTFDDFINGKVSKEQILKLPVVLQNNINYWLYEHDVSAIMAGNRKNVIDKIKAMYPDAMLENVDELILNGKLDKIFEIGKEIANACVKYQSYCEENIQQYVSLMDKLTNLKEKIDNKYYLEYVLELKEYLNKDDQEKLAKLVEQNSSSISEMKQIRVIFGNGLGIGEHFHVCSSLAYFDERSEQDLNDSHVMDYRKETIRKNRIKYFKYYGINLGDKYENYVNDPRCMEVWPSMDMIARIEERRDYYLKEANAAFFNEFPVYQETMNLIQEQELLDKDSGLDSRLFLRQQTSVVTNLKKENGEYLLYPLVCIYANNSEYDDKTLIHELNHLFELCLVNVTGHQYEMMCGWDNIISAMNQDQTIAGNMPMIERKKREYESFNEIINELIARRITKEMHESGIFILNTQDDYKDMGGTLYDNSVFLVEEFFNEYFDDIIASRQNNNIQIIWDKVGKENFDELNQLFHEFNENFSEREFYQLCFDLNSKKDTELVRKYHNLNVRKDEILSRMREYSKNTGMSL